MMKDLDEEPKIDEALLTDKQKEEMKNIGFKPIFMIIPAVIVALMIACIIVIVVLK